MKTLSAILMTLALSLVVPLHAQKYHDAIIEGATGPVKSIQQDRYVVRFNEDGEMTYRCGWMGDEEYFEVTRNRDSYPSYLTIYTDKEHNDPHTLKKFIYSGEKLWMVTYRSRGIVKTGAIKYQHDYKRNGILTGYIENKTYSDDNSQEKIYATYSNVIYDQYGNWISRDVTKESSKHGTSKERETRTITYYDAPGEVAPAREVPTEVMRPAEDYSRHIDVPEELTVEIMLERPLGVVNTREVDRSTLLAIAKSRPDLFIDPAVHNDFRTSVGSHSKLKYDGHLIKYAAADFDDNGRLESNYFTIQVPVEQIPAFAERLANALRAMGIPMKPKKWEGSNGFQGYHGPHTVTIMYDKKKSDQRISPSVSISITYDEHLL